MLWGAASLLRGGVAKVKGRAPRATSHQPVGAGCANVGCFVPRHNNLVQSLVLIRPVYLLKVTAIHC